MAPGDRGSIDISATIVYNAVRGHTHSLCYDQRRIINKGSLRLGLRWGPATGIPVRSHREQDPMQCLSCGSQIPDVSRFCLNCGAPTSSAFGAGPRPPTQSLYPVSPAYAPEPMTPEEARRIAARMKSYVGPAVLVFLLYWLFWLPGLVVNWFFYREAKDMERVAGQGLPGTGCLSLMLWLNFLAIIPCVAAGCVLAFAGVLGTC